MLSFEFEDEPLNVRCGCLRTVFGSAAVVTEIFQAAGVVAGDPFVGGFATDAVALGKFSYRKFTGFGEQDEFLSLFH